MISDIPGYRLLELYEDTGLSERELADQLGMPFNALHGKLFREKRKREAMGEDIPERVSSEQKIEPNSMELVADGTFLTSIEELLDFYKVDMSQWKIDREVVNWWGSFAHPHGQLKAYLSPINPEPSRPVLTPLQLQIQGVEAVPSRAGDTRLGMVVPDPHVGFRRDRDTGKLTPFHDRLALDIALTIARERQPNIIVLVGDWMDLAEWTDKYPRTPDMYFTTRPASIECAWWIAQFRIWCPNARIIFLEGNHEARMLKMLMRHLPSAYDLPPATETEFALLSIPRLLGLESIGIEYVGGYPNGKVWFNNYAYARHGAVVKTKPGASVAAVVAKAQHTEVFGHVHRIELATKLIKEHNWYRTVHAFTPGCLCHIDGRVPGATDQTNWQQGVGLIEYLDTGLCRPIAVPINDGVALLDGQVIVGQDRLEDLREQTNWEF